MRENMGILIRVLVYLQLRPRQDPRSRCPLPVLDPPPSPLPGRLYPHLGL